MNKTSKEIIRRTGPHAASSIINRFGHVAAKATGQALHTGMQILIKTAFR